MMQISDIRELYGMVCELLVEVVCPVCNNVYIATMEQAKTILVFGCINCGTIDNHDILSLCNTTPFVPLIDHTDGKILCQQEE